ncbi:MAG: SPFH domain-containing protein [Verrucomicrobiota bacterium]
MKKIALKLLVTVIVCTVIGYVASLVSQSLFPHVSTDLALAQVNGDDVDAAKLRGWESQKGLFELAVLGICLVVIVTAFWSEIKFLIRKAMRSAPLLLGCLVVITMSSCRRPYDTPEYVEVDTNETAFVIPLEGKTDKQVQFESAEALAKSKVASKRIQITHRWSQTGRWDSDGKWIKNIRVIKVSRTPLTREWVAEGNRGTSTRDQAVWVESSDSVGFSTGFSCTALINEKDTALFLYSYSGQSLADMMDSEIRARIQADTAEFAGKYTMDLLRDKKGEMIAAIRADVIPFFAAKGITITTIGQFGGFSYENKKIQDAIDDVFIAQQEKQVASAQLSAQSDKNKRLEMEGEGVAAKVRKTAEGQRDAAVIEAEGRAKAIALVAEAAQKAGKEPLFLQLKQLEAVSDMVNKWNGQYPNFMMGGDSQSSSGGPAFLLNMPMPGTNPPPAKQKSDQ